MDGLMSGADHDIFSVWLKMNDKRSNNIKFKTKTVSVRSLPEGIEVTFSTSNEGWTARVLQAVRPSAASLGPHPQRQEDRG
jgi:pyruvate/2-oxoglutarate dehydrogenase complex dihydrolipoamide dehydrogenase (E3) component